MAPTVTQARHAATALLPPFLQRAAGRSFTTEGLFTLYDIDADIWWRSLLARFPSYCPVDAVPFLARDRLVSSGPYEPVTTTRIRVRQWIDEASLAGLPLGVLLAMQAYFAPGYPRVRIVTRGNLWYTLEENAVPRLLGVAGYEPLPRAPYENGAQWPRGAVASPIERLRHSPLYARVKPASPNFDWDSVSDPAASSRWWNFWGVIHEPSYAKQQPYDAGAWLLDDPLESVGLDIPYGTVLGLRQLVTRRKPAKARCVALIFAPSLADFDPSSAPGAPDMPDGTWSWSGKPDGAGGIVPARRTDCRFLDDIE